MVQGELLASPAKGMSSSNFEPETQKAPTYTSNIAMHFRQSPQVDGHGADREEQFQPWVDADPGEMGQHLTAIRSIPSPFKKQETEPSSSLQSPPRRKNQYKNSAKRLLQGLNMPDAAEMRKQNINYA